MKKLMMSITVRLCAAALLLSCTPAAAQTPAAPESFPKELDAYLAAVVRDWEFPGLAVAVVKDGKVVAKGYGVRELGKPEPIDANTIFDAASLRDKLGLEVKVWLEGDAFRLQYGGGEIAVLTHWHYNTFMAQWINPLYAEQRSALVQFNMSPQGAVVELTMNPGDQITARR